MKYNVFMVKRESFRIIALVDGDVVRTFRCEKNDIEKLIFVLGDRLSDMVIEPA